MKKFVCLIICAVLTAGAAVTANAKTVKPHKGVEIYNSAKSIGNNTLYAVYRKICPLFYKRCG